MGIREADHATPRYPQKFALTSPTSGGRSVGIVRSRTQVTEFSSVFGLFNMSLRRKKEKKMKEKGTNKKHCNKYPHSGYIVFCRNHSANCCTRQCCLCHFLLHAPNLSRAYLLSAAICLLAVARDARQGGVLGKRH
jgi:hypothetical protein